MSVLGVLARKKVGVTGLVQGVGPISGEVLEVNGAIADHPEWVNKDPYGKAWLIVVSLEDPKERAALLDASAYETFVAEEEG